MSQAVNSIISLVKTRDKLKRYKCNPYTLFEIEDMLELTDDHELLADICKENNINHDVTISEDTEKLTSETMKLRLSRNYFMVKLKFDSSSKLDTKQKQALDNLKDVESFNVFLGSSKGQNLFERKIAYVEEEKFKEESPKPTTRAGLFNRSIVGERNTQVPEPELIDYTYDFVANKEHCIHGSKAIKASGVSLYSSFL